MKRLDFQTLLSLGTILFLVVVLMLGRSVSRDMETLSRSLNTPPTEKAMQSKTTKWKDAAGVEWSVTTERAAGETLDEWCQRHDEAVAATQREHPPA